MLSTRTLLLSLATLPVLLAPATADAAKATFSVTIEAHRTAGWDHPRIEFGGDCNGKPWVEGRGSEDFKLTSDATGRLVVEGTARGVREFAFGTEGPGKTVATVKSPAAESVITRTRRWTTGRTGGWCGGALQHPAPKTDCGTRLAPYTYRVSTYKGTIGFRESLVTKTNEVFGFYSCKLHTPEGVPEHSLPSLEAELPVSQLFNPRKRTIVIEGEKAYTGRSPVGDGSVAMTMTAAYKWTMTLERIKPLTMREENG